MLALSTPATMFGKHRSNMGSMVLDSYPTGTGQLKSKLSRHVLGMKIMTNNQLFVFDTIHRSQIRNGLTKCIETRGLLEITDILADKSLTGDNQGDGVFQVGSHG